MRTRTSNHAHAPPTLIKVNHAPAHDASNPATANGIAKDYHLANATIAATS